MRACFRATKNLGKCGTSFALEEKGLYEQKAGCPGIGCLAAEDYIIDIVAKDGGPVIWSTYDNDTISAVPEKVITDGVTICKGEQI